MPRYRIDIEYDGGPYAGWQRQAGHPTVQEAIEKAILAFSGETVTLFGAGRTDSGVHAFGQVAHFDLSSERRADTVIAALNAHLIMAKETVSILSAARVADDFDARFSAKSRHYLYRIGNRRTPYAIDRDRLWYVYRPLDADRMHEAAQRLVGHHDFSTFRAAQCQAKSPMRTLEKISVERHGDEVHVYASARSFLHNQVRSMVGSLRKVGEGRWDADKLQEILEARDRQACGPVAPAHGLYLIRADYD